jgi:LysM domain
MFARAAVILLVVVVGWISLARPSEGAGRERVYVVRPTDTLWAIATANYAGDPREAIWRLRQRNGLEDVLLRPGQRLILPP